MTTSFYNNGFGYREVDSFTPDVRFLIGVPFEGHLDAVLEGTVGHRDLVVD